jgi:hypothetical protein
MIVDELKELARREDLSLQEHAALALALGRSRLCSQPAPAEIADAARTGSRDPINSVALVLSIPGLLTIAFDGDSLSSHWYPYRSGQDVFAPFWSSRV